MMLRSGTGLIAGTTLVVNALMAALAGTSATGNVVIAVLGLVLGVVTVWSHLQVVRLETATHSPVEKSMEP
jgi:F0F1-type ATP synthase assembly protein I